jgi:hypothetical protein
MELQQFKETNTIYAENQPEYIPLPAYKVPDDPQGRIICSWKLTWKERFKLLWKGIIWHQILTFNKSLQPQLLTVDKPNLPLPS